MKHLSSRYLAKILPAALLVGAAALTACSKENDVDQSTNVGASCTKSEAELAKLCPPNTALEVTSAAEVCKTAGDVKDSKGNVTDVCKTDASCSVRCRVIQVCGNGTCEENERESCAAGAKDCFPCARDCAGKCKPTDAPTCVGNKVLACGPNGELTSELIDCGASGQLCSGGKCVGKDACGNGVCESGEGPGSVKPCPEDCAGACEPGKKRCKGLDAVLLCSADGKSEVESACPAGTVCGDGATGISCNAKDTCGNGVCEAGEGEGLPGACPQDCKKAICGNGVCEINESAQGCPQDCNAAVCGNKVCEKDEQTKCPQDCDGLICLPNTRSCEGTLLKVCNAQGTAQSTTDCAASKQLCGNDQCVPAGACGNGLCESEASETLESCPADCTGACGNKVCDAPFENAKKCAKDCPAECGDGFCTGGETPQSCDIDCPLNCGDGTCGAGESRKNCEQDCGFCGNGVCESAETAAPQSPPDGSKESCQIDCLKLKCSQPSDCDDGISCTADTCGADGICVYTPDDSKCGGGKCLGLAATGSGDGCCADLDGDGFTALSCGGNDCFDDPSAPDAAKYGALKPAQVFPGAVGEVCNGVDRNCSGDNKAKVTASNDTSLPLTPDTSEPKTALDVAVEPDIDGLAKRYLIAWTATFDDGEHLQLGLADSDGILDVKNIITVGDTPATLAGVTYSPQRKQFAVAWTTCDTSSKNIAHLAWVGLAGDQLGKLVDPVDVGSLLSACESPTKPSRAFFARAQDKNGAAAYTMASFGGSNYGPKCGALPEGPHAPFVIGEDGAVTKLDQSPDFTCNGNAYVSPVAYFSRADRFGFYSIISAGASGNPFNLFVWTPDGKVLKNNVDKPEFNWRQHTPVFGDDGDVLVGVTDDPDGLLYQRIDPLLYTAADKATEDPVKPGQLIKSKIKPLQVLTDAKQTTVAVIGADLVSGGSKNVYALLRKQADGAALSPTSVLAKGDDILQAKAVWDGQSFRVFYTSKIKGRHQIYMAPLRCE